MELLDKIAAIKCYESVSKEYPGEYLLATKALAKIHFSLNDIETAKAYYKEAFRRGEVECDPPVMTELQKLLKKIGRSSSLKPSQENVFN